MVVDSMGEGNVARNCDDFAGLERQVGSEDALAVAFKNFSERYADLPREPDDPVWPSAQAVFDDLMSRFE